MKKEIPGELARNTQSLSQTIFCFVLSVAANFLLQCPKTGRSRSQLAWNAQFKTPAHFSTTRGLRAPAMAFRGSNSDNLAADTPHDAPVKSYSGTFVPMVYFVCALHAREGYTCTLRVPSVYPGGTFQGTRAQKMISCTLKTPERVHVYPPCTLRVPWTNPERVHVYPLCTLRVYQLPGRLAGQLATWPAG